LEVRDLMHRKTKLADTRRRFTLAALAVCCVLAAIAIALPGGASSKKVPPADPGATAPAKQPKTPKPAKAPKQPKTPKPAKQQQSNSNSTSGGQPKKNNKPPKQHKNDGPVREPGKSQEVRAQQQAEARARREAQRAERQSQRAQRRSARTERANKRTEGNKESSPAVAPPGSGGSNSGGGQGSAPGSTAGGSPAATTQPGQGKTETPSKDGATNKGGSNERGGNGKGNAKSKAKAKTKQRAAVGGAGAVLAAGATAAAIAPTSNEGDSTGTGSKDSRSDSNGNSTPPTIVERVVHDIPSEDRIAIGVLAGLVLLLSGLSVRERRRSTRSERDMLVDGLTGVGSRTALQRQLESEWKRAARHDRPLGLLLLDLDDLKQINDAHGHAAGDNLLRSAGQSISERVRQSDTVARLGGDEFVVVCPETSRDGLAQLADALQEDFRGINVGVSVGLAERESIDQGPEDLMARADAAMYEQKRAGAV
jgi:diguanylate cyclase (GGDEF)-like protein